MAAGRLAEAGQDGGQFKINHAKTPVRLPVSYIADVRVVMADAKRFQFFKQLACALRVQMFYARAAIGGDDAQPLRIGFEEPGDKSAAAGFQRRKTFTSWAKRAGASAPW